MIPEFGFLENIYLLFIIHVRIIHYYAGIYFEILGVIYLIKIIKDIFKKLKTRRIK